MNAASYASVADHLVAQVGRVDALVGPVGSGGSMSGIAARLRHHHDVVALAVDTPGSILFGPHDSPRELRGLGNSLHPGNLDHTLIDEVHWCPASDAYAATRNLHRHHALFQGPTSGAAYLVGRWWAALNPGRHCVVVLPDEGTRYLDTVYDDAWLGTAGGTASDAGPVEVAHPRSPMPTWSRYPWRRRTLDAVLAAQASALT